MTHDEMIAVIAAHRDGKKIEWRDSVHDWAGASNPVWNFEENEYRIKPEPKWRAWKPEEVPVGAIKRRKGYNLPRWLILNVGDRDIGASTASHITNITFEKMLADFEHSTDNGKTWQPCGVLAKE